MNTLEGLTIILIVLSVLVCPWFLGGLKKIGALKTGLSNKKASVIITSYNDAANLRKLIPALYASLGNDAQIIIVDLGSSDATINLIRGYGCEAIELSSQSDYASRKNYARYIGAKKATNQTLIFIDAECVPSKDIFSKAIYLHRKNIVVSAAPYQAIRKPFHALYSVYEMARLMLTGAFTIRKQKNIGLFPEFMVIDKTDYFETSTHDKIPRKADTGQYLSRIYNESGIKIKNYFGGIHLYRHIDPAQLTAISVNSALSACLLALFIFGGLSVFYYLIKSMESGTGTVVWCWFYILFGAVCVTYVKKIGDCSVFWGLLYPVQIICALAVIVRLGLKRAGVKPPRFKKLPKIKRSSKLSAKLHHSSDYTDRQRQDMPG